jgi:hypothetical protein
MQYARAVFIRPASHYTAFISALAVVTGFSAAIEGATYASRHQDPVRYGPAEWITGPWMLVGFGFLLGLSNLGGNEEDGWLASWDSNGSGSTHNKEMIKLIGISVFTFGGGLWGIGTAFNRWFDYTPVSTPRSTANGGTTQQPLGPHCYLPAYLLLAQVCLLWFGLALAWMAIVFLHEEKKDADNDVFSSPSP